PLPMAGEQPSEGGGVAPASRRQDAVEVGAAGGRVGDGLGVAQEPQGAAPSRRVGHQPSAKAAWRVRTARSTSASATMHEVRMVEVEIMSMLISSLARVSNMVAAMPGCDFMPTPTSETRATSASAVTPDAPSSSACACAASTATARSVVGTVNEMSVVPCADVFCTIMSTLIDLSASAPNRRAA